MKFEDGKKAVLVELERTLGRVDPDSVAKMLQFILAAKTVFIAGAGRSGLVIRSFAMRLAHLGRSVQVVGDVTTRGLASDDVLLMASGSGETPGMLALARSAVENEGEVGLFTIFPQSPLARLAKQVVLIPAPTPKAQRENPHTSVQPMGSLFEQSLLVTLDVLTMMLMDELRQTSEYMFRLHANLE